MDRSSGSFVAEEIAKVAIERELASRVLAEQELAGGLNNNVFEIETPDGEYVVRLGRNKRSSFEREAGVIRIAALNSVPTPEILAVGELRGWSYMIEVRLPGTSGSYHNDPFRALELLGACARQIHSIPTRGFGCNVTAEGVQGEQPSWRDWLEGTFGATQRLAFLRQLDLISADQEESLKEALSDIASWKNSPVLHHGDLRLKNVILGEDGAIRGIIDWEDAVSSIGPHWDISIALHDLSIDGKEAFLKGYGLSQGEIRAYAPIWRFFNILNYVPSVRAACESRDMPALDRLRTRFAGALSLYG